MRQGKRLRLMVAGATAVAAVAGYLAWRPVADSANADDPLQVQLGRAIYGEYCAACHGARLEGQPGWQSRRADGRLPAPPHDETGHTWHHPDRQLFELTKHGLAPVAGPGYATDMPAFAAQLDDAEIWAVLAFIKSRWPADIRARQERLNRMKR